MDNTLPTHREPETAHSTVIATGSVILSVPQQQALEWLTTGGSITEAAQVAGVCRQTVSDWLHHNPDFAAAYQTWRQQSLEIARGRLAAMTETAVDNVVSAVRDKHDLQASQFVLRQMKVGEVK
jgi:hypothetical protein